MRETESLEVVEGIPDAVRYCELRRLGGMSEKGLAAARQALPRSLYSVLAREGEQVVGMGRIVGDGYCQLTVVDVVVHPDWQGRGLGKAIMARIREYIERHVPREACVSLIADGEAHRLYARYGFRDCLPAARGMLYRFDC